MDVKDFTIPGFKASAVAAGIKKDNSLDLAMIVSDNVATAAAVFTTNKVKAAPVILSMEHIRDSRVRAVIVNSGNANACTGKEGMDKARMTAKLVAEDLGIAPEEVIVASTGVIGANLDMDLFKKAMPDLAKGLAPDGIQSAARAIMTTDSFEKISRFEGEAGGKPYQILGIAKGAGMIMPDMATMLCFIVSDIRIDAAELQKALSSATETSFNRITVDGDTSTNDMVLVMANGVAGNDALDADDREGFLKGLNHVMTELATMIIRDGEGATKVVYVKVKGAATGADALIAARTIANSSLVKTAFYGQDPNWGRIIAALGRSDISMKEEEVSIWIDDVKIVENGLGLGTDHEERAAEQMKKKEFTLTVDLRQGDHEDRITTCDLTHEYVSINADYRT